MPMPLKVRVATANCGNDGPGLLALRQIKKLLETDDLDCLVLSGQELNRQIFTSQFQLLFSDSPYRLVELGWMHTHTKLSHMFDQKTGIGNFVIVKEGIDIENIETITSRRSTARHFTDRYNKGGLISKFNIVHQGQSYVYHHISAHLDSRYADRATYDWHKLLKTYANPAVQSWQELVAMTPDMLSSGVDANTRNIIDGKNIINPWLQPHDNTKGIQMAPLGNHFFSASNTYHTHDKDTETRPDPKREGFVQAGTLDVIGILDPYVSAGIVELNHQDGVVIASDPQSSRRDHSVIISPAFSMMQINDFYRVKCFLSAQLKNFSDDLSGFILSMEDTPQHRQQLIDCYNSFLSKSGLVSDMVKEHGDTMASNRPR